MARNGNLGYARRPGITIDDIGEEVRRLYTDYTCHVLLAMDLVSFGRECRWFRVSVRRRGTFELLGSAQFGTGVIGGAATFEGAAYVALLKAREHLQRSLDDGNDT